MEKKSGSGSQRSLTEVYAGKDSSKDAVGTFPGRRDLYDGTCPSESRGDIIEDNNI